jgi:signal transduction histidine kinase
VTGSGGILGDADDDQLARDVLALAEQLRASGGGPSAAIVHELLAEREATRRKLVRLGFDLHDGPLQTVAAMLADLRHFQSQLEEVVSGLADSEKLVARVDDLVARTIAIGEDVRTLILGENTGVASHEPLSVLLEALVDSFTGFSTQLSVDPALDEIDLSDSQRIALFRVIQAALDNVEQHSGATHAAITLRELDGGIEAEIVDDGRGFDADQVVSNQRSIGLTAMRERVRLLGGTITFESRPGGPTHVAIDLPRRLPTA